MPLFDDPDPLLQKAISVAMGYISYRPRSEKELTSHLRKKKCSPETISKTVRLMQKYRYLDDEAFARQFIRSRKNRTPKSKSAISYELGQKGISPQMIEDLLADVDDLDLAVSALKTRLHRWRRLESAIVKKKSLNFLRYRGFGYGVCIEAWDLLNPFQETP